MSEGEYEQNRMAALQERRQQDAEGADKRSLEVRYGPGSFGCHEAVHVTHLVIDLLDSQLANHSAVLLDPQWYSSIREAQSLLYRAYNVAAGKHLDAPMPTSD